MRAAPGFQTWFDSGLEQLRVARAATDSPRYTHENREGPAAGTQESLGRIFLRGDGQTAPHRTYRVPNQAARSRRMGAGRAERRGSAGIVSVARNWFPAIHCGGGGHPVLKAR